MIKLRKVTRKYLERGLLKIMVWKFDIEMEILPLYLYNDSVYKNENGGIIGVFAAARDISQLKKAENKLQNVINKLEISNKDLKEFAYVASHDLKEPL